jgi:hypothetical protein
MSDLEIINRFINHDDPVIRGCARRAFDAMLTARDQREIEDVRGWCLPAELHLLALSAMERLASATLNQKESA